MLNPVYMHLLSSIYLALRILWKEKCTMQKQLSLWNRALRLFHLAISKFLKNSIFLLWNIIDIHPYINFRCTTWVSICMYYETITTVSLVNTHHQHNYNIFFLENFSGGLQNFPGGSDGKVSACNVGDQGSITWVRKISWRRKWQPTQVFLLGKFHGGRSLVGYSPWGCKESNMTEWLHSLSLELLRSTFLATFKYAV